MSFPLVQKSMTLNDLERRNGHSKMATVSVWAIVNYDRLPNNISAGFTVRQL